MPTGHVTLVKCGGECLDEYYLSTGTLTENTNYLNMCRTQVRVKLDTPAEYFLRNPLGNHHIMVQGELRHAAARVHAGKRVQTDGIEQDRNETKLNKNETELKRN